MKKILSKLFMVYVFLWVLIFFLMFYPFFVYFFANEKRYIYGHKLRVIWGKLLFITCFVRKKVYFDEPIDTSKKYVIVANHSSYIDIPALAVAVPLDFNFMAKIELSRIPLFGIFFRTIDIAVDRKNAIQSAKAFSRANRQLKENVRSIAIFPEGGIKKIAPKLSPFKDGACKMAIENQVAILPVSMPDNHARLFSDDSGAWPGVMRIYVHKPVDTAGYQTSQASEVTKQVFDIINSKMN